MGNARARDRRAGIRRQGPVERANIDVAQERARERQRDSRRRRRENASSSSRVTVEDGSSSEADENYADGFEPQIGVSGRCRNLELRSEDFERKKAVASTQAGSNVVGVEQYYDKGSPAT